MKAEAGPPPGQSWLAQVLAAPGHLSARASALAGWRRYVASMLAGATSILAFAPFFLAPVLLLTFPLLFWLALEPRKLGSPTSKTQTAMAQPGSMGTAAACGWCFGFGFHLAGLYWIGSAFLVEADRFAWAMPFAVILMPAGLAVFHALALAVANIVPGSPVARAIGLALALAATEWLRGTILTGFPWNTLGYALTGPLVLMQSAGIIGIYGLSLLAALLATLPGVAMAGSALSATSPPAPLRHRHARTGLVLALTALPLTSMLVYGAYALSRPMPPDVPGVVLRLVQPNIPQRDKFLLDKRREIFETTLALSATNGLMATGSSGGTTQTGSTRNAITHVIWPEAAMPFLALRSPEALARIGEILPPGTRLIAGTLRLEVDGKAGAQPRQNVFNSTIVLDDLGRLTQLYDKVHLVPFGEYLPFQETLEAFGLEHLTRQKGGFARGAEPRRLMRIAGLPPVSMLICYEVIFPGMSEPADGRPGLLANLTNDAWFGPTSGPHQHFHQSRVRAVEQGVPLIRVANTGISAIVDAHGRILQKLPLGERGVIDTQLPGTIARPPYAGWGDSIFAFAWVLVSAILVLVVRREKQHI